MSYPTLAVILAAGQGTRMRSALPKVMHTVANRPLLGHVLDAAVAAGAEQLAVVVGPDSAQVEQYVAQQVAHAQVFVQQQRLGTAHALLAARAALQAHQHGAVLVLFGDTPLISAQTLALLRAQLAAGADVVVAGFTTTDPGPYGRLLVEDGRLTAIREAKDCSAEELAITFCNGGVMGISAEHCLALLDRIGNENAQGEFYLTDAVELAGAQGLTVVAINVAETEVMGVNDRVQLHAAEQVYQASRREAAMRDGVTLQAADTVFFSADTQLEPDVLVEPHVVFGPGVTVERGSHIAAFSRLQQVNVKACESN